ncbi:MAG: hypothetical protein DRO01_07120 [Thermoproteota archaeon]|nr:MAG: hypothetical protein DRO01_07120 [Candidatus Korarchaeota archaeon]
MRDVREGEWRTLVGKPPTVYIGADDLEDDAETGGICAEGVERLKSLSLTGVRLFRVKLADPSLVGRGRENVAWAIEACGDPWVLLEEFGSIVTDRSGPESNPGLALLLDSPPAEALVELAERIRRERVTLEEVHRVAEAHGVELWELGGSGLGVIGAFAAAVLSSAGVAEGVPTEGLNSPGGRRHRRQ